MSLQPLHPDARISRVEISDILYRSAKIDGIEYAALLAVVTGRENPSEGRCSVAGHVVELRWRRGAGYDELGPTERADALARTLETLDARGYRVWPDPVRAEVWLIDRKAWTPRP